MLKKLTLGVKSKKISFAERKASIHICDANCTVACTPWAGPKFELLYDLKDF